MPRTTVAIVGRPNVGKSSLFNSLAGGRISIEDPTSGVTRDRLLHPIEIRGRSIDLVDTGGIGVVDCLDLADDIERQIDRAIAAADIIIFLLDCREGLTPLDMQVAERLRPLGKKLILAANKADTDFIETEINVFYQLGLGETLPISVQQGRGLDDLEERILAELPDEDAEPAPDASILKIAFVGKRNAGKSSLINALAGEERVIVSNLPGTTRDSVDVRFEKGTESFIAIDTAGLRKRGKMDDSIEFYAQVRSERAIGRADVVVLMIDASEPVGKVDKRICSLILEQHKPCILAVNKWDLALAAKPEITPEAYHKYLLDHLPGLYFAPLVATSALTGENVWGLIKVARDLDVQAKKRVTTGQVNRTLQAAYTQLRPPLIHGRACKLYYGTQAETQPPTFIIFCNAPERLTDPYKRYLSKQFREQLGFTEVPVRFEFRSSHDQEKDEG